MQPGLTQGVKHGWLMCLMRVVCHLPSPAPYCSLSPHATEIESFVLLDKVDVIPPNPDSLLDISPDIPKHGVAMTQASPQKDLSYQDATFLFISSLQEHLAKSDFVNGVNSGDSPAQANGNRPTEITMPVGMERPDKERREAGARARITRLKPPREAK